MNKWFVCAFNCVLAWKVAKQISHKCFGLPSMVNSSWCFSKLNLFLNVELRIRHFKPKECLCMIVFWLSKSPFFQNFCEHKSQLNISSRWPKLTCFFNSKLLCEVFKHNSQLYLLISLWLDLLCSTNEISHHNGHSNIYMTHLYETCSQHVFSI